MTEAFDSTCLALQYPAHGSVFRNFNRYGTVSNVHRSGPPLNSFHSRGIDTRAPGRARWKGLTAVFVRLSRM